MQHQPVLPTVTAHRQAIKPSRWQVVKANCTEQGECILAGLDFHVAIEVRVLHCKAIAVSNRFWKGAIHVVAKLIPVFASFVKEFAGLCHIGELLCLAASREPRLV